jgi:UDP-N-acetylmuramoylalanine--D-glutamate ligase
MTDWNNKKVLVIGLGKSGRCAAAHLAGQGAEVCMMGTDAVEVPCPDSEIELLKRSGVRVVLGQASIPAEPFELAVVNPGVMLGSSIISAVQQAGIPIVGELELGYREIHCPNIAITGTNGKTTTTHLIREVLQSSQRKTEIADHLETPLCSLIDQSMALDFLTLEVTSFQLETICDFRPSIGVLLNLVPDHLDHYDSLDAYARVKARLFENQQPHDWCVIQSEALARLRSLGVRIPGKVMTFSAQNRRADVYLDRGLLISKVEGWTGPLLNMVDGHLSGPHQAENLMAALLVGRILRIPLETAKKATQSFKTLPHRGERVRELGGVLYINDSKAGNPHATAQALRSVRPVRAGEPNIWLIAGGDDKGLQHHDLGPLISQRVKGVFLIGKSRDRLRAAWSLFAPCQFCEDLVEAITGAAKQALPSDVVLLSPACSSLDMFRDDEHPGEVFRKAVNQLSTSRMPSKDASAVESVVPSFDQKPSSIAADKQ